MADVDLDARLDDVFASDPKQFTASRDALARDLKAAGRADDADAVKTLRKPTVAVAAVNRAAREQPDLVAELVEVGEELAALQSGGGADRDELRELTRRRRTMLQQLTDHAAATTERPDNARSSIAATLDTASLDEQLRDDLRRGRLTHELSPAARFVLGGDDTPSPRAAPRRSSRPARAAPPPRDELAARRAKAELVAARERAEEAEESVQEHSAAAAEATERLGAAHRHIADLEAALADARAELTDLKRSEREAQRAERRARTEQERIASALNAAERAVDETK
jgi:hypothetical protein